MYMFIPYETETELKYPEDYKPIKDRINCFKLHEIPDIIKNLESAAENAFICHSELLERALCDDISELKRWYIIRFISCCSSGTIASYIGKTQYKYIDKAVNNTILYIARSATEEELVNLDISPEGLKDIVTRCFNMNLDVNGREV